MTNEPSAYVQPDVSDARVRRLWSNVSSRLEQPQRRAWRWAALCLALGAGAAGGFWLLQAPSPSEALQANLARGMSLELRTENEPQQLRLADGSSLTVAPHTDARLDNRFKNAVELHVNVGEISFDVTHVEGRRFSVIGGRHEVRVVGTQFSVKSSGGVAPRVEVRVQRGAVEIRPLAHSEMVLARVTAGQKWEVDEAAPLQKEPVAPTPSAEAAPGVSSGLGASAETVRRRNAEAAEMMSHANELRRAGDIAAAAAAYEQVSRSNSRELSGLAAFEAGRLRFDRLHDVSGAIRMFERATRSGAGAFHEDALARLVAAYAQQGNWAECQSARQRYASRYPNGVHRAEVESRCGER